ncbi:MAG: hypothetical protein OXU20_34140 [Myxococcales bacterium]|nr:hypothetical protein [Myxococcales bacterium]
MPQAKDVRMNDRSMGQTEVDILIVGYGFSVIPLIRELLAEGRSFTVISDGKSVWDRLEAADRLDCDLVSSLHSSVFSFELARSGETIDRYPTSREFLDTQRRLLEEYRPDDLVVDRVVKIDNHPQHSIVLTRDGRRFKAKQVVVSTAFHRELLRSLVEFDFEGTANKTVVLNTSGDSGNLLAAKLVPRGNRVIMLTNGLIALDKFVNVSGIDFALDQLEFHNIRHISKQAYRMMADGGVVLSTQIGAIGRWMFGKNFAVSYPVTNRKFSLGAKDAMPNGLLAIKMWAIDTFAKLFDGKGLEGHIREGFLLNDLAFFVDQGLVELWPKDKTLVDTANKTLRWDDREVSYDELIDAETERPNLPPIEIHSDGASRTYEYHFRRCLMGVVPEGLHNLYVLGLARPTTGGLANIVEMQCLLTHRLLTDTGFCASIQQTLTKRLDTYDRQYYPHREYGPTDHLVWYGSFTDDIAKLIGVRRSAWSCRTPRELLQNLFLPNNPIKFRRQGRYRVDGANELLERFWDAHNSFNSLSTWVAFWALLQATAISTLLLSPLPLWASIPLSVAQFYSPIPSMVHGNATDCHERLDAFMLLGLVASWVTLSPWVAGGTLAGALLGTYVARKTGKTRQLFGDLKLRRDPTYRGFFERYREAFLKVYPTRPAEAVSVTRARMPESAGPATAETSG